MLTARRNDQATSRCTVPKGMQYDVWKVIDHHRVGSTGHEIAIALGGIHLLNSVSPRLAPLRRAGLIKDSGARREKQIVWVTT